MSSQAYEITNENTIAISPEKLEEIRSCMRSKEGVQQSLIGAACGAGLASLPSTLMKFKVSRGKVTALVCVGAIYGYAISRYLRVKDCVAKILNDSNGSVFGANMQVAQEDALGANMYENRRSTMASREVVKIEIPPESSKQSIFDMESSPQMNLLDEFPTFNESANSDLPENKEPERTITYRELRQRNRESHRPKNIVQKPIWARDQSKDQPAQVQEFDTESKESDPLPEPRGGKRKTKYGDAWD